jgi:hypothetical protein
MPLGGRSLSGALDPDNARSGESCNGHNDPVGVGGSPGRDVKAVLIGKSDIHEVAKRVVSVIFGASQALD